MFVEKVTFPSGDLQLEGVLQYPEDERCEKAVLLFSPHPKLGGDMDNNVIRALGDSLPARGCATLRFNYRGVGRSESSAPGVSRYDFWDALDQSEDYGEIVRDGLAALAFLKGLSTVRRLFLAGYSFGVRILEAVAAVAGPEAVAAVSPPVRFHAFSTLAGLPGKKLLVCGDGDFAGDAGEVEAFAKTLVGPKQVVVVQGQDHFFRGYETELAALIGDFLADG